MIINVLYRIVLDRISTLQNCRIFLHFEPRFNKMRFYQILESSEYFFVCFMRNILIILLKNYIIQNKGRQRYILIILYSPLFFAYLIRLV